MCLLPLIWLANVNYGNARLNNVVKAFGRNLWYIHVYLTPPDYLHWSLRGLAGR